MGDSQSAYEYENRMKNQQEKSVQLPTDKQARKEIPIATGVVDYFPDALAAVAHVSFIGNQQHNPGKSLQWDKNKSQDHADCIMRHLIERGTVDNDGLTHSAKVAWRALALLQTEIETCRVNASAGNPEDDYQAQANRIGGTVIAPNGRHFTTNLRENTASDPHNGVGRASASVIEASKPTPGVGYGERDRAAMINKLVEFGCSGPIAVLIAKGTTFAKRTPFSFEEKFVYVAGPMRGIKEFNFPEFDRVRDYLLTQGFNVISPADIDRADTNGADPASRQTEYAFRDFQALHFLKAHGNRYSGIVLLPGWEKSIGAAGEFFMGRWLGLRFYTVAGPDNANNPAPERLWSNDANALLHNFALANAKAVI